MGLSHDEEQPGLELAPVSTPQVAYGEGLEYDPSKPVAAPYGQNLHTNPPFANHQGQYHGAPTYAYEPYRQYAYPSPTTSGWSPSSHGLATVAGQSSPEKLPRQKRIWGLPRKRFWLILGAFLVGVLVIALALALGLGLGLNQDNTSSSSASSTPTPSATNTPAANATLSCPSSNGTTYTSATSGDTFRVYCSVDYNSGDSDTKDLTHMESDTIEGCINDCASDSDCVGAGWGWYQPDSSLQGSDVCWLKSQLGTSQSAIEDWAFVIKE